MENINDFNYKFHNKHKCKKHKKCYENMEIEFDGKNICFICRFNCKKYNKKESSIFRVYHKLEEKQFKNLVKGNYCPVIDSEEWYIRNKINRNI